jgi:hypothetical protein
LHKYRYLRGICYLSPIGGRTGTASLFVLNGNA